jgi:hypothetical protein
LSQLKRSRCLLISTLSITPSIPTSLILPVPNCTNLYSLTSPLLFLVFAYLSENRSYAHMAPSLFHRALSATIIQQKVTKTQSLTHSFTNTVSSSSAQWSTPVEGGTDSWCDNWAYAYAPSTGVKHCA